MICVICTYNLICPACETLLKLLVFLKLCSELGLQAVVDPYLYRSAPWELPQMMQINDLCDPYGDPICPTCKTRSKLRVFSNPCSEVRLQAVADAADRRLEA